MGGGLEGILLLLWMWGAALRNWLGLLCTSPAQAWLPAGLGTSSGCISRKFDLSLAVLEFPRLQWEQGNHSVLSERPPCLPEAASAPSAPQLQPLGFSPRGKPGPQGKS